MTSTQTPQQRRARFFELHARPEVFVMPNPYDVGSAKMLANAGFEALATTSAGFAWTLGVDDGDVTFDQLLAHVSAVAAAVDLPLNVDSERLFAEDLDGIAANVRALHGAGAAVCVPGCRRRLRLRAGPDDR
jgi:2-methylisocitrate lyase-like PEP mutase family enzyme